MSCKLKISAEGNRRARVQISGVLDETSGAELRERVEAEITKGLNEFLFDLRELSNCKILGREALRQLQASLYDAGARSSYLTGTPRMRGMTLMVINGSKDPKAATFVNPEEADKWLSSSVDRRSRNVSRSEKNA